MPAKHGLPQGLSANTADGNGNSLDRAVPVPHVVNETKLQILAVMEELDRPVLARELHAIWQGGKSQEIFDYHLSTLVRAGAVRLVMGSPELRFGLVHGGR